MINRVAGWVAAGVIAGTAVALSQATATAAGTPPVLPIPKHLTAGWTAPAGRYSAPARPVVVDSPVAVDLSAASIVGGSGYLFRLEAGGRLTITGGTVDGTLLGLVLDAVGNDSGGGSAKSAAGVSITRTRLTDVRSIVFAGKSSSPIDVSLDGVDASGLGDGVRGTINALDVHNSTLQGGGAPPSGSPAGLHSLDDPQFDVAVPAAHIDVVGSTITGFTSPRFQGDSIVGETRVATADIENCVLGHNSDSGGIDSKIGAVTFKDNTVYSDGYRAIASHYGTIDSSGNTIFQKAKAGKNQNSGIAYQASGVLNATDDIVVLSRGAYLAQSSVVVKQASGAPSTYPRVGDITISGVANALGALLHGPVRSAGAGGYRSVITIIL